MTTFFRAFRTSPVLTPQVGQAGLLVKRAGVVSHMSLADSAAFIGDFNHTAEDDLYLDDVAASHNNHASDPGGVTLSLTQNAGFNWSRSRGILDVLALSDSAHVYLLGMGGGGGGDPDLSKHSATFDSTMVAGQPVYVSGSNHVDKAQADNITTSEAVGLVLTGATAGNAGEWIAEGSIVKLDWTAVTGSVSLTSGSTYYLSETTAGLLSESAPTTRGNYVVRVGKALSTTKMDIEIAVDLLL